MLALQALNNIDLAATDVINNGRDGQTLRSKGFLSSETRVQAKEKHDRTALGIALSADMIYLRAGRDLNVTAER